ncbi:MAG TPA: hypothetical protein VMZ28_04300 [Kofleriaceae bacterium]|nr:hypothetical protein [Kofleriaceae bacterium]
MSVLSLVLLPLVACGDNLGVSGRDGGGGGDGDGGGAVDGGPVDMTFRTRLGFRDANVPFLAFQDGDGDWRALEGDDGSYEATRMTDRFGVAWVCTVDLGTQVRKSVQFLYAAAGDTLPDYLDCEEPDLVEYDVTVNGIGALRSVDASVREGEAATDLTAVMNDATDLTAPPGAQEAVAVRINTNNNTAVDVQIARDLDFDLDTGNQVTMTFAGGAGYDIEETEPLAEGMFHSELITALGARADLNSGLDDVLLHVEAAALEPDDMHYWYTNSDGGYQVAVSHDGATAPVFDGPTEQLEGSFELVSDDPVRFAADSALPDGADVASFFASQSQPGGQVFWYAGASRSWLGDGTVVEMPDLTELDGWDDAWSHGTDEIVYLTGFAMGSSMGLRLVAPSILSPRFTAADDGAIITSWNAYSDEIDP